MAVWLTIHPKTKACLTKHWSDVEYKGINPDIPRKWLGLRCDGLVIVDCDSEEAVDWWYAHVGVSRRQRRSHTYTVKTNHGYHLYYVATPGSPEASIIGRVHEKLDIKAGRGALIVVPPSPGYTELYDRPMIAPFDPKWIPIVIRADGSTEYNEIPDGQGNNTMFSIACKLRQLGFTVPAIEECLFAINPVVMRRDPMASDKIEAIAQSAGRYATSPDWPLDTVA